MMHPVKIIKRQADNAPGMVYLEFHPADPTLSGQSYFGATVPDTADEDAVKFDAMVGINQAILGRELTLDEAKECKATCLSECVSEMILSRYNRDVQVSLNAMLTAALFSGNTNRAGYIGTALAWIESCLGAYYVAKEACLDAKDFSNVHKISIPKRELLEADP